MPDGKYIWIDGIDGSGKTTLCRALFEAMTKATGKSCVTIALPSRASAPGALIRDVFEGKQKVIPEAMLWLFIAEAADMEPQINAWLAEGRTVIVDRHVISTLVYQTELHTKEEVERVVAPAKFRKPDAIYILDVSADVSIARRDARGEARNKLYEPEDVARLETMRQKYRTIGHERCALVFDAEKLSTANMVETIMLDLGVQ